MKAINLNKIGDKELDLTLEEYLIRLSAKDNIITIKPEQFVLLNLADRYFIGNIEFSLDDAYKNEKGYYEFNGYFLFTSALWEISDSRLFIPTESNTIILKDLTILYKIKNLIKQTTLFKENILTQIYTNTKISHTFMNNDIVPRERYLQLYEKDKLFQNKQLTLREILKLKNDEYDMKYGSLIEELNKGKQYLNNILFYERFDDRILLPFRDGCFNCFNFISDGFYKEIFIGIRDKERYKVITDSTDEYNIRLHIDYIEKQLKEINTLCKQCF